VLGFLAYLAGNRALLHTQIINVARWHKKPQPLGARGRAISSSGQSRE
jgi:hypothetical protein